MTENPQNKNNYTVLLDPGTSSTIVSRNVIFDNKISVFSQKGVKSSWQTVAGTIFTNEMAKIEFCLDEFSSEKKITWEFHVAQKSQKLGYDMIIAKDLLRELGIIMDFADAKQIGSNLQIFSNLR